MHTCQVRVWPLVTQSLALYRQAFIPLLVLAVLMTAVNTARGLPSMLYLAVYLPCSAWAQLASLSIADRARQGAPLSARPLWQSLHGKFWKMLWATTLVSGITAGASLVAFLPAGALWLIVERSAAPDKAVATFLLVLAGLVAMIGIVWLLVRLSLYGVVFALEAGDLGAIQRSWQLTRGHAWKGLCAWSAAFLVLIPGMALTLASQWPSARVASWRAASWPLFLAGQALMALALPAFFTFAVGLYHALTAEGAA